MAKENVFHCLNVFSDAPYRRRWKT